MVQLIKPMTPDSCLVLDYVSVKNFHIIIIIIIIIIIVIVM